MSKEIIEQIRKGLEGQVKQVMDNDEMSQLYVHEVTQSWLLLQILEKLEQLENGLETQYVGRDEFNAPVYRVRMRKKEGTE